MAAVQILGVEQLKRELSKFPEAVQARAVQAGVRKAAGKLRTALRRAAYSQMKVRDRKRTNKLRQAIRSAVGKRGTNKGKAWVGLKKVPGESRIRFYYKTLEFGRKPYSKKGRGKYAGSPPMKPFWRTTVNATSGETMRILIEETQRAIAYEAGKAYGRMKGGR
jgi:HK97 gp10 family phage protein